MSLICYSYKCSPAPCAGRQFHCRQAFTQHPRLRHNLERDQQHSLGSILGARSVHRWCTASPQCPNHLQKPCSGRTVFFLLWWLRREVSQPEVGLFHMFKCSSNHLFTQFSNTPYFIPFYVSPNSWCKLPTLSHFFVFPNLLKLLLNLLESEGDSTICGYPLPGSPSLPYH